MSLNPEAVERTRLTEPKLHTFPRDLNAKEMLQANAELKFLSISRLRHNTMVLMSSDAWRKMQGR